MRTFARLTTFLGAVLVATTVGCRGEPVDTQALLNAHYAGLVDLQRGQLPEAEAQFKTVISLAPKDPLGYANLGLTYLRGGRYKEAEDQLRTARRLNPESAEVGLIAATLYSVTGRESDARETLEQLEPDPKVMYALAELDRNAPDSAAARRYEQRLRDVLTAAPANLAVRLDLAGVFVRRGLADSAARHLEDVRRLRPEPPIEAKPHLDTTLQRLRVGLVAEARAPFDRFLRLMELTSPYQAALDEVRLIEGPLAGRPVLAFNPQSLITAPGLIASRDPADVRFTDVTNDAGLPLPSSAVTALALGDYDGDGTDDLFVSVAGADGRPVARLYRMQGGYVADMSDRSRVTASLPAGAIHATFADFDNDGWLDLFAIGGDRRGYLLRNTKAGAFEEVAARARVSDVGGARTGLWADLDHDGDLDLLLLGEATRYHRNNLDGTFTEMAAAVGLQGSGGRDAAFADFDGDARLDLFVSTTARGALYRSSGLQGFTDATEASGLATNRASGVVAVGDYNNDGRLDLFTATVEGEGAAPWRNGGNGVFTRDSRAMGAFARLGRIAVAGAALLDYDNDGWLDLVAVGSRGVALLRNDGRGGYADRTSALPPTLRSGSVVLPTDIDGDGDQDLFVGDTTGARILRNDGGSSRMAMNVQLLGLRTGSGKNNNFGVGSRIDVRSGELYQTRVVTSRTTHFGLGSHLKADVLRVEWTNGVPQIIYLPGTDQDVLELEQLKGSCAFLYTWDGKQFRFVTDVMWRSALGMPLGIMAGGSTAAYAPAGASQEYLRIPGDALQPRNGRYVLQFTEELWETAYLDEIRLLAVDHPDSVDVYVDERFVPPGPVSLRMFQAARRHPPLSAVNERGTDVLAALRDRDDVYVSDLTPIHYQGLAEPHDLVMDLGKDAGQPGTFLFLRGWIYPTDASINVALGHQTSVRGVMPSLEVRNARGQWETVAPSIGFPSGKDKTIVLDLAGKFPTADHRVRIRTNLQIYWDQAFVARDAVASPVTQTVLAPISADLHFRGYSRMYRKGGRNGPHWFDYADVTTASPWRTIEGGFTRFGAVLPLLGRADDMYVVMAPGDETTVEFDAATAAPPPAGWRRTFLLYTDGWIKDADLNTAYGNTVEPLPFHAIREYPYAPGEAYPADSARQQYLRQYNTRVLKRR